MSRPSHILCHGFLRSNTGGWNRPELTIAPGIPGLIAACPNQYVEKLKSRPWAKLPTILGKDSDKILIHLFQDCGIFVPLVETNGNLNQISGELQMPAQEDDEIDIPIIGKPLCDLTPFQPSPTIHVDSLKTRQPVAARSLTAGSSRTTTWNDIRFVRHRILYGRPVYSANGRVAFGLHPIRRSLVINLQILADASSDVLNRLRTTDDSDAVPRLLKYVFPRQHGLHNAFTSKVDRKESAHDFLDYSMREQEIKRQRLQQRKDMVPKRLRGRCQRLLLAILKRHAKCPYIKLLDHYCSTTQACRSPELHNVLEQASPSSSVSAFCRAAISHVFSSELWGIGPEGDSNTRHIMTSVDRFVKLQRYESMSLHDVMQNIKTSAIHWLDHPGVTVDQRLSASDLVKRQQILAELVYYVFDSFLIPLINSNFHVTESSSNRNQLFYFRHNVWQRLSQPALSDLRMNMFEEVESRTIGQLLSRRTLGTSHVRLLPKDKGMRPIINLRRRVLSVTKGKAVLGKSINSAMTPVFNVLNYEKGQNASRLGSSIFSAEEIFPKLQTFRSHLSQRGLQGKPLYFAKADVRSCFDTIPQELLMNVVSELFSAGEYAIGRYAEGKSINKGRSPQAGFGPQVAWKFQGRAVPANQDMTLSQTLDQVAREKSGNVFVDGVVRRYEGKRKMTDLLEEHIQSNLVQIGKTLYRQTQGIPQGSIVSSLLCSLFYAGMEEKVLNFVKDGESLLLRLIDDFLLITTNEQTARHFMRVLHAGLPDYGVTIKREKSVVNFDMTIDGHKVTRLPQNSNFPYCGQSINTDNLNLSKDPGRRNATGRFVLRLLCVILTAISFQRSCHCRIFKAPRTELLQEDSQVRAMTMVSREP